MTHRYAIHGLVLSLPFRCDDLEVAPAGAVVDVTVREGEIAPALAHAILRDADMELTPTAFMLRGGPSSAFFLAEDGSRITVQRQPGCEAALFFHHLLYPVMAALLRQRDLLVFHASSASMDGAAVLVAGESGAGKSTTVAGLMARGWVVQGDDVTAVRVADPTGAEILPGARHLHLDDAATTGLALPVDGLERQDWHRMKMAVPAITAPRRDPVALRRIVWISRAPDDELRVERVRGRAKLPWLLRALYGPLLPEQIQQRSAILGSVLGGVELIRIARPSTRWSMDEVIAAIGAPAPSGDSGYDIHPSAFMDPA